MSETKQRKQRTPRNLESIIKGAMALSLEDKAKLVKELKDSISDAAKAAQEAATHAVELTKGL